MNHSLDTNVGFNEVSYANNIIYPIGEIQSRFLSFPTVDFPAGMSAPLLTLLKAC
jgi:hypothetical protein